MEDNQKKYVISIPSEDFTGEWTQDMLDQKKDKLIQKYPDARIEEEMDMAADEQYDDNLSYGITLPDGTTERWTGAMMNEKGAKLRKKYPDARISKLAFWSDNQIPQDQQEPQSFDIGNANAQLQQQTGVPAPEAPKAYAPSPMDEAAADEYRAEQKVIQDAQRQAEEEYLASLPDDQREYVELMNSAAGIMERLGTYRDRLDAEDSDKAALRRLRSNDEDALDKVYEGLNNNTYYKAQLARQTEDIEVLKDRIAVNAPDILADYPAIKGDPYASRGPEGDMKAANLEAAGRFAEDARKAISAPLRYDDSKGLANYAKGAGSVLSDPDFWNMGITDVQDKAQLRAVLQKVNDAYGSADDIDSKIDQGNLDGILDLDEQYLLQSYLQMQDARSARYHDTSRGYKAGAGSAESAGFMLEMALTSGLGGAVKSGVTKGLGKWLLKGTQKIGTATKAGKIAKATSREAAKLVAGQTGNVLSAAARMPFMPSSYGAIAEQGTVVGDDGQLVSLGEAIKEGTLDNLTEVVTEGMGPATMAAISNTVGAAGLGTLLKKISRTRVGEFARKVANSPAYETMKKMGYDGLGEELLEEFDAAVIDQVRGNPEAIRDFVQTDNLLTTVLSFAPMTIMGGAVSTGQKMYAGNRLEKTAQTLRDKLIDAGYTQSQADYFIDVTRNSTPQEISMVLTPVLNQFAEGNMAGAAAGMPTTGDLFNAVKEYGKAVVRYQAFDGIYQQQEQNQRTEAKNSILDKTGDNFWVEYENGSRPTVETGTLADGTEVYVVSSVDENGMAAAIASDGKKMFVNAAMLPEGTQIRSLDEYLSEQVMSRKLTAEQKRIEEEKAARAQQVREQAQPGSQINLGTAEAPVTGEVIRQAPDGIIVQTENGVSLLSWDEAANAMNIGAAPLTDEQIEQQEIAQMEAADAEKDAAMAETEEEAVDAVEETEAAQQDEVVSEPLPVKADGSVDQTTLWNQSPERWAQWNDEQRQDGGANSLNYISGAIAKEQAKLDEMTAAYNAESDFDVRSAMEPELAESQDRIARLAELQQKYVPAEQTQEEVKAEAPAAETQTAEEAPAAEQQPAEMSEDEARANEIRQTLYDLYSDDSLSEAEIEQYVEANVKGSQEDLDKHMKKAPQMGRDMAKYKEAKAAHEAKAEELRKQRDFWREAQTYVTIPEVAEADMEPQNALEFAARELSSRSGIKLQPESFKRHTGYGSEASKFLSVQRSKAKGGMTLEEAGERLMELDRENNTGFFDQNDPNAGLNAILDVIQSSATSGDLGSYIRNAREQAARQEVAAAREAMMAEMGQQAAQEETPQPETEFVSTLEEDMPEDIWEGASRQVTNAATSIEDLEETDASYQQRLAEVDTRMAAAQSEEERRAATDERSAVLQHYMDEISSEDKATVLTPYNYAEVMRADGCSEQSIREVEDAVNNPLVILGGFMCNGRIYVMTDVADINRARRAYVHERQHIRTRNDNALIDRVLKAIPDRRTLLMFVELLSGTNDYRGYSDEVLADEIISFAMERAYSAEDFVSSLQYSGIYSQELLNIINDIINEQREDSSLSKARRREGLYSHERRRAQGAGRQNGGAQRAGSSEVAQQGSRSAEGSSERTVSKQVTGLPLPSDNRQLEGNVRFSKSSGTLVGMHNISEEKLRKAIKQGGLANPSTAVVNISEYSLEGYGEISLLMPSSLVDSESGDNVGTYTGDAWTPTYPSISRKVNEEGWEILKARIRAAVGEDSELYSDIVRGLDNHLKDNRGSKMEFVFLKEKGIEPEIKYEGAEGYVGLRNLEAILGVKGLNEGMESYEKYRSASPMSKRSFNMWLDAGGDMKAHKELKEQIKKEPKIADILKLGEDVSFAEFDSFTNSIFRKERDAGRIDSYDTFSAAAVYVDSHDMRAEFDSWLESLMEDADVKEVFFAGYTRDGDRIYKDNTLENVSRYMRQQSRVNSYNNGGLSATKSVLLQRLQSLKEIKKESKRLKGEKAYNKAYDELKDRLSDIISDLADMQEISSNQFINIDYAEARLQEAIVRRNPVSHLNSEYGYEIDADGEFAQKLKEFIKDVKKMPAKYFETKFERPVYLNEFAAAVMPTDTSDDIKQAVSEAGLPVFEYDPSVEGSRREAALKASEVEGVRFQIGRAKDKVENLFTDAVNGRFKGKPVSIGTLTEEGKKYLESISGLTFKDKVDFVLNSSDLMHMYNEHFGANEKDPGSNIPLTIDDIRNIVDVILNPEKVLYLGEDDGKRFAFLAPADSGAYNLIEVYTTKRGNLSSKTFYKTKKGVSHRAMILEKESRHSTSETNGATLSDAKIPILFDIANQEESGVSFQKTGITPEVREEMDRISANAIMDGTYMRAPNGKPTNLTADQWALVRTEGFKRWFGDWELPYRMIDVVRGNMAHGFANFDDARQWAKDNIVRVYGNEETGGKGEIEISNNAVKKYLSGSAVNKSDSKDLHLAVLKVLPSVIRNGVIAETHADYMKDENGERTAESRINPDVTIHRVYGAVRIGDDIYRVKVTIKEHKDANRANTPHSYEATKIELLAGTLVGANGSNPNTNNSISAAKLLNGVEKSYESGKYLLDDHSKVVDENGEPRVMYHGSAWQPLNEPAGQAVFKMNDGILGEGAYFASSLTEATMYAEMATELDTSESGNYEVLQDEYVTDYFLNIRNAEDIMDQGDGEIIAVAKSPSQIKSATDNTGEFSSENPDIRFQLRSKPAPEKTGVGYKVFYLKDGKLYPPMVANLGGVDTPVGVWLDAEEGTRAGVSKTGRPQVKQGGKGTQGGSGTLAYRPGWHLGEIPYAIQFNRKDENGDRTLFPADFVWAEVEYADDVDYQEEAMSYGMNANGKFQHSLAGLPKLPVDGSYRYRTNPNPETDPWIITGAMKVNRLLTPSEVDRMVADAGRTPQKRQEGAVTDEQIEALNDSLGLTDKPSDIRFSKTGTPTGKVVNDGLRLSQDESARLAGNIFEALPESARESIVEETFRNGFDMKSAIFQMSARLAEKEELTDEEADMAKAIAQQVEDAVIAGGVSMTRPLTTPEALWMLYRHINDSSDIIGAAREAVVADNLGFSPAAQAANERNDDYIRFRKGGDAAANAKASLYNRGAVNVWTRLKESFIDKDASVDELVKAIEKKTGKKAEGFENILMALNQQSSKGLASMEKYERRFLNPMLDEIRRIMTDAKKSYDDIVRYVILKHGLERNELFAKRDAREYYNGMYGKVADRMKTQSHAQRVVALSEAKKAVAAIDAEMATATGRRLERLKEQREQAMYDLTVAELVLRGDEKQNEADLKARMDDIDAGTDAKYKEFRDKDYSGITSMFYDQLDVKRENYYTEEEYQAALMDAKQDKYKTLADVEAAAAKEVEDFESAADTARLWETINAATKETLRQQYQANMISKDQYDSLREMFKFYVPLRGFKDNTAEDMYTYYRKPNSTGWVKPILAAEGRKTEAESPFGWIANMAGSAIASNVKNEAKLALYYFVSNRPDNGIATITKTWFRFSHTDPVTGRKVYVPAYPPFTEDLSSDAAKASYEKWQQDMKELQKKGEAYESGQRLNLGNAVVNIEDKNKPEHVVNVKIGGKDYSIIINGNPRAAQAVNGDLNIESSADYGEVFGPVLRWMSSVNTSYNPEFWITNMMRDMAFTWMAVSTKESPAYRKKFGENYRKALKVVVYSARNENGKLGSSYLEKMYQEFVDNGGVTGYTQIKDNETWEKEIDKYLSSNDPESRRNGWMMRRTRDFFHGAHRFGESLEQVSRFAAFLTSREMGKSMSEAVSDAKEITVNFNRKGSGKWISFEEAKTLTDKNGQPLNKLEQWAAVGFSAIAPLGRRFIMFFNAAIQGLNATYRLWKANPKRFAGWAAGYTVLGILNAVLHAFMDDDDDYMDMPEYERRQNLMIGWNGFYLKWAMPQEARAFYALGDLAVESIMGRNAHESILGEALSTVADVLPLNPTEGLRAAVPSVLLPVVEIAINKDYKGSPIYNEQIYKDEAEVERAPKWASAYEDTGKLYIKLAQGLNFITGGDEDDAGFVNIQPEKVEHIVESAFGGTLRTANKTINMFTAIADEDTPVRYSQLPFVGRVLAINDERFTNAYVSEVFDFYRGEALHAKTKKSKYEKADDQAALEELKKTDEYKIYEIYEKYNDLEFKALDKSMKLARNAEERRNVRKQQDAARKRMIKEISDL